MNFMYSQTEHEKGYTRKEKFPQKQQQVERRFNEQGTNPRNTKHKSTYIIEPKYLHAIFIWYVN